MFVFAGVFASLAVPMVGSPLLEKILPRKLVKKKYVKKFAEKKKEKVKVSLPPQERKKIREIVLAKKKV